MNDEFRAIFFQNIRKRKFSEYYSHVRNDEFVVVWNDEFVCWPYNTNDAIYFNIWQNAICEQILWINCSWTTMPLQHFYGIIAKVLIEWMDLRWLYPNQHAHIIVANNLFHFFYISLVHFFPYTGAIAATLF